MREVKTELVKKVLQEAKERCGFTLEWPAMPLNLKAPIPQTSTGTCRVGKGLPIAELGVQTGLVASVDIHMS